MSIIRVTVRTFQSVEHANMFVVMSEKVANESNNTNLKINVKVIQNVDQCTFTTGKNQVPNQPINERIDPNVLEVFCDIHPDEPECLVYDD